MLHKYKITRASFISLESENNLKTVCARWNKWPLAKCLKLEKTTDGRVKQSIQWIMTELDTSHSWMYRKPPSSVNIKLILCIRQAWADNRAKSSQHFHTQNQNIIELIVAIFEITMGMHSNKYKHDWYCF